MSAADFCRHLSPNECFLDINLFRNDSPGASGVAHYAGVLSTAAGPQVLLDFGEAASLEQALSRWRRQVQVGNDANREWQELSRLLWKPVAENLSEPVTRVWICPDAELGKLPWQLFASGSTSSGLLLSQLDSARELVRLKTLPRAADEETPHLLLVGGVDFAGGKESKYTFAPLPGSTVEAEKIARLGKLLGFKVEYLSGRQATQENIVEALSRSDYVHLATHGFFFDERPDTPAGSNSASRAATGQFRNPLVESGLVLSAGSDGSQLYTAEEVVGSDWRHCRLLTLSACQTGLGEEATGQGVLGLRASLMAAGARCILMSLWKVPDESTQVLMERFYRNLWERKLSPARALVEAQLSVRDEPYDRYKSPINWAGWLTVGEAW